MNLRNEWNTESSSLSDVYYDKEETIQSVKDNFDFRRYYSAEGKSILIDKTYTEQVLVQQHTNPLNEDKTDRKIHVPMDTKLKYGSYVTYENSLWLVFSQLKNVDDAYKSAQIRQCNYTLNFQNGTTTILEEPCIVLSQSDSLSGEDTGNIITIPSTQRVVYIQYNINTAKLAEGKRLYIDQLSSKPKIYKITNIDRITKMNGSNGLWKLVCDEDQTQNANDHSDLLIADYIATDPTQPNIPSQSGSCKITFKGNPEIKYGSNSKTFTAVFLDTSGNVLTANIPVWTLDLPSDCIGKISISTQTDNYIIIKVENDSSLLNKTFTVNLTDTKNTCYASQVVKVVSPI